MKTNNPLRGLLHFYVYAQSGNIAAITLLSLALAVAAVVTGNSFVYNSFFMIALGGIPYIIIVGMGGKTYPKWERFRIAMPIKRGDLASAQYLCILLSSLAGLPLAILVAVFTFNMHEFDYSLATALINILSILAMPLLFAGLIFPLGNTTFGENKQETLVMLCLAAAIGVNIFMPRFGNWLEWAEGVASLVTFAVAVLVFVGSYYVSKKIYAKKDF